MSPDQAYLLERPHLNPLPHHIPAVYMTLFRTVDVSGYVAVDTNRYSVPERLVGKKVEVHKSWDRILIFFKTNLPILFYSAAWCNYPGLFQFPFGDEFFPGGYMYFS